MSSISRSRTLIGLVVLLAAIGIAVVVGGPSITAAITGQDDALPPALVDFESAGARCVTTFHANSSVSVSGGGATTSVTYSRNVSLPDPSHAIGGPTFTRENASTYALRVPVESTTKPSRDCAGVARYTAVMRIPGGDTAWTIHVYHDGERVATLQGQSSRSGASGAVSASEHVTA